MFRKSTFSKPSLLAIALSVAVIASATAPAAAFGFVKQPQVSNAYNPHMRTTVGPSREFFPKKGKK